MSATDNKSENPLRVKAEVRRAGANRAQNDDTPEKAVTAKETSVLGNGSAEEKTANNVFSGTEAAGSQLTAHDAEQIGEATDPSQETFEYIMPGETWKQHQWNKHKAGSVHKAGIKAPSQEEIDAMDEGYVFAKPRKQKRHRTHHHHRFRHLPVWKRILLIVLIVLLALIIALAGTILVLREIGRSSLHNYENAEIVTPTQDESGNEIVQVDNRGHVVTYDGVSYELNNDLFSIVFIGADDGDEENADLQMADAIYILTVDTKTGKVKILGISRDTMADVDLYSEKGKYIDTQRMQIAFSYAYGSDVVTGGKNTTISLSRLFYGLPLENYFAINLDALTTLNDTIGGVTLTSSLTFQSPIDGRTIKEGETVTLHGKEAEYYVQTRVFEQLDANNDRMKRQQEYIRGFADSIIPAAKKDISVISRLYDEIRVNSDTSLDLPEMTYIASTALTKLGNASDIEYITLTGEITEGEFAEMNVKNQDVIRTMLDVFYTPLADVPESLSR